jgi:hypothetical protein
MGYMRGVIWMNERKVSEVIPTVKRRLPKLADYFGSSLEATAMKMARVADFPCAILICEKSFKPTELKTLKKAQKQLSLFPELASKPPEKKLRVKYAACSKYWDLGFIPPHASISEDSSIITSAATGEIVARREAIEIKHFKGTFQLETYPIEYTDEDGISQKTFTLIQPER